MKFDHYEFRIAAYYLPALINGDHTGMTETDEAYLSRWIESTDRRITHWDVTDHGDNFARCEVSGLHADCAIVRGYFPLSD